MTKRREAVYVGLDIGGTKLMVAAADAQGQILASTQAPTPLELKAGLNQLHAMIAEVTEGRTLLGMGAAAGGPLDQPRGIVSPLHQPE